MIIAGAKGFSKEVLEVIYRMGHAENVVFFDNLTSDNISYIYDLYPIIKTIEDLKIHIDTIDPKFTLGLGTPLSRMRLSELICSIGGKLTSVICPSSSIGQFGVEIGTGVNIMQNAILTTGVKIGEGALLNINCTIGHDSSIGKYSEICPGVNISGNCHIGEFTFIGTNSTILPNVRIGSNVTIGAGSLITKDIDDNTLAYGSPAKPIKRL
jgi:sugar O-acyltransferase (sialic acid O-acetyltransferase NeuD family)